MKDLDNPSQLFCPSVIRGPWPSPSADTKFVYSNF